MIGTSLYQWSGFDIRDLLAPDVQRECQILNFTGILFRPVVL
jgi:hypothetical protein